MKMARMMVMMMMTIMVISDGDCDFLFQIYLYRVKPFSTNTALPWGPVIQAKYPCRQAHTHAHITLFAYTKDM